MRVLVTGATGFTGGHLARSLAQRGYRVRALVRSQAAAGALEQAGIEATIGDLRDPSSLAQAVGGERPVEVV